MLASDWSKPPSCVLSHINMSKQCNNRDNSVSQSVFIVKTLSQERSNVNEGRRGKESLILVRQISRILGFYKYWNDKLYHLDPTQREERK